MSTFNFSPSHQIAICNAFSVPRFTTYLATASNNTVNALKLYQWNLEVSAALMTPIAIAEVSLRNSIDKALTTLYNADWPWNPGLIRELPDPPDRRQFNPRRELNRTATKYSVPRRSGKVVADLKFVFWEKLLRARHEGTIWGPQLLAVFPNSPRGLQMTTVRQIIFDDVSQIRDLRNRIAHHEKIYTRDLSHDLSCIKRLVRFVGPEIEHWMNSIELASWKIAEDPRANF